MFTTPLLNNKTALITGASKGIGRATALAMAQQGANIAINYWDAKDTDENKKEAQALQQELEALNVKCNLYSCDVSDFSATKAMVAEVIADFTNVDILVNNAGVALDNPILRITEKDYDRVMDINLKGSFNTIRHMYSHLMKNRQGTIINIASICGLRGWPWQSSYAASKGGLIALTKTVAKELAGRDITCNAIAPGFIETDMTAGLTGDKKEELLSSIPLKRVGKPADVAQLAVFLASPLASYITGEIIKIDGGLCI